MAIDPDLDEGLADAGLGATSSAPAIVHAARDLFDQAPFREVTVGMIARTAGVNEVTVYRIFGSKDGVAAACWLGNIQKLRRGISRDQRSNSDPVERIRRHLGRLARVAKQDPAVTDAMLQAVQAQTIERGSKIGTLDPRAIVPLPLLLEPLVAEAQAAGHVTDGYPSMEISALLSNTMLLRVMSRKAESAGDAADFVANLLLHGIVPGGTPG